MIEWLTSEEWYNMVFTFDRFLQWTWAILYSWALRERLWDRHAWGHAWGTEAHWWLPRPILHSPVCPESEAARHRTCKGEQWEGKSKYAHKLLIAAFKSFFIFHVRAIEYHSSCNSRKNVYTDKVISHCSHCSSTCHSKLFTPHFKFPANMRNHMLSLKTKKGERMLVRYSYVSAPPGEA